MSRIDLKALLERYGWHVTRGCYRLTACKGNPRGDCVIVNTSVTLDREKDLNRLYNMCQKIEPALLVLA